MIDHDNVEQFESEFCTQKLQFRGFIPMYVYVCMYIYIYKYTVLTPETLQ